MMTNKKKFSAGKKAVVLLSGGLDSAVTFYLAKSQGFSCHGLIFDYGQRHRREIQHARKIARSAGCLYQVLKISMPWKGSSLLDKKIPNPFSRNNEKTNQRINEIPITYVPARNIVFLSFALSYAEAIKAQAIFIGAHAQDYSGYPDCRPEFFRAFAGVIGSGTKAGNLIKVYTPLIDKSKAEIIKTGQSLNVPFGLTWSCYEGKERACEKCDSCFYRAKGFKEAGILDPLIKK